MFRKNVNEKVRGRKPVSKELTQLFLTVEELDTDIPTVLTTCNPYFLDDAVEFCYREGCYKQLQNRRSSILFFSQKGNIRRKEEVQTTSDFKNEKEETVEELDTKRKNKFNFCDRATQTVHFLLKERANQTEPSSQLQFDGTVSAAEIAFAYQEKEAGEKRDREEKSNEVNRKTERKESKALIFSHHLKFLRFCERMVDQNLMSDISIDYSFYDTPSDEFKDKGLGSLLPLWKFNYQPMRGMAITGLSWNSRYSDMFAAAFGSHDVTMRHRSGCVCIFSLKCPSHPEKVISCKSGVCCVEFSPYRPHLLAVGLADGSVAVHDVRKAGSSPVAINKNSRLEHNDAVNQVKWLPDNIDGQPNFCSISADCKVIDWILAKVSVF
ncbi:dynein intermediate chain 2, ciliary-like, partial [Stegodyphus dumicola]|uniref:dynein intermediate chain 2, ciliary-like n=1 Tax=Stegodyphus dumicola TaxID=202533 RepID=UPI0015AC419E